MQEWAYRIYWVQLDSVFFPEFSVGGVYACTQVPHREGSSKGDPLHLALGRHARVLPKTKFLLKLGIKSRTSGLRPSTLSTKP